MRSHEQEYGREEADGLTECCEHGIPAMCQCKKCDESERESRLSPAPCSTALYRWKITRIIKETYDGWGNTAEEAIAWLNANSGGAGSVQIQKETAEKAER